MSLGIHIVLGVTKEGVCGGTDKKVLIVPPMN
jgi:hypothetical protein